MGWDGASSKCFWDMESNCSRDVFFPHIQYIGVKIRFWKDIWSGNVKMVDAFPSSFTISMDGNASRSYHLKVWLTQ